MMFKLLRKLLPLLGFMILVVILWRGLDSDPRHLPSTLIDKPAPAFSLSQVQHPKRYFNRHDLLGHLSLVNVWASWCSACRFEHPVLMDLKKSSQIVIYGIDYKDIRSKASTWLREYGNPYRKAGFDPNGIAGINWGVYGTPETFLIDSKGIVRYRHVGPLTHQVWKHDFAPKLKHLS